MRDDARDTVRSFRPKPFLNFRGRGGGPLFNAFRENADERPKILDRLRERKEEFVDRREKK